MPLVVCDRAPVGGNPQSSKFHGVSAWSENGGSWGSSSKRAGELVTQVAGGLPRTTQLPYKRHIDHLLWSPNGLYLLVRQTNTPSVTVYDVRRGSHRQAAFGAAVVEAVWLSNRALLLCCAHQLYRLDISHSDLTPVSIFTTKDIAGSRPSRGSGGKGWVAMSRLGHDNPQLLLLGSDGRITSVQVDLLKCTSKTSTIKVMGDNLVLSACGRYCCAFSCVSPHSGSDQLAAGPPTAQAAPAEVCIAALAESNEVFVSSLSRVRLHASHGELVTAAFLPQLPSLPAAAPSSPGGSPAAGNSTAEEVKATDSGAPMLVLLTSAGYVVFIDAASGKLLLQWEIPERHPPVLDAAGHHSSPRRVVSADVDELTGGIVAVWASGLVSVAWLWPEAAGGAGARMLGTPRLIAECVPTGRGVRVYAAGDARSGAGSWSIYQNQDKGMLRDPDAPFLSQRLRSTLCGCVPCSLPREAAAMPQGNTSASSAAPLASQSASAAEGGLCSTRVDMSGRSVLPVTAAWAGHGLHACTIGCKGGFTSTVSVALPPLSQVWPETEMRDCSEWPLLWCASTGVALGRVITPLRQRAAETSLYDTLLVLLHDISSPFGTYQHIPQALKSDHRLLATAGDGAVPLRILSMTLLIVVLLILVLDQFGLLVGG